MADQEQKLISEVIENSAKVSWAMRTGEKVRLRFDYLYESIMDALRVYGAKNITELKNPYVKDACLTAATEDIFFAVRDGYGEIALNHDISKIIGADVKKLIGQLSKIMDKESNFKLAKLARDNGLDSSLKSLKEYALLGNLTKEPQRGIDAASLSKIMSGMMSKQTKGPVISAKVISINRDKEKE